MDEAEKQRRITRGRDEGSCPKCGNRIEPGHGCGSGALSDGIFCDTGCQAAFHKDYYRDRIRGSHASPN
jgi:hypothetical protein